MAEQMTCGTAIVQSLVRNGVDTVFGLPGVQTYELFDALARAEDQINLVGARHEQATAYMAYGYAKSTGKIGVYTVVPGPGVLNSTAALCTAYGASAPVLCLTGQVPAKFIGSGVGHLHELPDQLATLRSLTKWSERINHPSEAPGLVTEAFKQMTRGRPRPVALETPWDTLGQVGAVELLPALEDLNVAAVDADKIEQAAALLHAAQNPMIMVGSGAIGAQAEILELAQALQAPVVSLRGGRGIVSDENPYGFNCAAGFQLWHETDVLIGIGTRMELQWFRWSGQPDGLKVIQLDIDPGQIVRFRPEIGIVGDAQASTRELVAEVQRKPAKRASRQQEFVAIKEATRTAFQKVQPQMGYLNVIREVLPRDGFFVEEVCQAGFAACFGFPIYEPRTFVTCGHQGTLGFGFPTSLGVKVGNPDKTVIAIAGDGGFMFGVQELATAVQYGINVVTVVFNNNAFGNVMRDQQRLFDGRIPGAALHNPDFVALAESFGALGLRATNPAELKSALETAIAADRPALIEVPIENEASPWEFLMPTRANRK